MNRGLSPLKSIRERCRDCSGYEISNVRNCKIPDCSLFHFRMGRREGKGSVIRAIRKYCLWCCVGSAHEVKICESEDCPLHIYRFGKNPNRRGIGGKGFKRAEPIPVFAENPTVS